MALQQPVLKRSVMIAAAAALVLGGGMLEGCASRRNADVRVMQSQEPGAGIRLFQRRAATATGTDPGVAIGVNTFLWRASLDVLNFMPLVSADPYGGLVITDWYVNPEKPDERFKVNVYILDSRLRADGVNVAVNRQTRAVDGQWVTAPASPQTEEAMENSILARARALRIGAR